MNEICDDNRNVFTISELIIRNSFEVSTINKVQCVYIKKKKTT